MSFLHRNKGVCVNYTCNQNKIHRKCNFLKLEVQKFNAKAVYDIAAYRNKNDLRKTQLIYINLKQVFLLENKLLLKKKKRPEVQRQHLLQYIHVS